MQSVPKAPPGAVYCVTLCASGLPLGCKKSPCRPFVSWDCPIPAIPAISLLGQPTQSLLRVLRRMAHLGALFLAVFAQHGLQQHDQRTRPAIHRPGLYKHQHLVFLHQPALHSAFKDGVFTG